MNSDGGDPPKKTNNYRKSTWRRPTRRCLFIIIGVTVLCIIICIVLAVQLRPKSKSDCPEGIHCNWSSMPHSEFLKDTRCSDTLCTTRPCIRSAYYALSRIDPSKDPCDDFYEFACGTYEKESMIFPDDDGAIFTFQEMENAFLLDLQDVIDSISSRPGNKGFTLRLAKKVYDDCINTDHHIDVMNKKIWKKLFAEDGMLPWPLIAGNHNTEEKHYVKMMSSTLLYGTNPFLAGYAWRIVENANNKTYWLFHFKELSDMDTLKKVYESSAVGEGSLQSKYLYIFWKILTELGIDEGTAKSITSNITALERELIEATTKAREVNEDVYKKNEHLRYEYHNDSCEKLDVDMENIKWCKIAEQHLLDLGVQKKHDIRIDLPSLQSYFKAVNGVLGRYLERDIVSYIALKFIVANLKYMPSPLRELNYLDKELFPVRFGDRIWQQSERWQQCVAIIIDIMIIPIEKEYVRQKLDEEKVAKVRHMVKKIKESYKSVLNKWSWMKTSFGRRDPKAMIEKFEVKIGNLEKVFELDDTAMDNFFASESSKSELQNPINPLIVDVLEMQKLNMKAHMSDNKKLKSLDAHFLPGTWGIFTEYLSPDTIRIPYSAFNFPMHLQGRPMYTEYAVLGSQLFRSLTEVLAENIPDDNATYQFFSKEVECLEGQLHLIKTGKMKFKVQMPDNYDSDEMSLAMRRMVEFQNALGTLGSFQAYKDYLKENGDEKGLPGLPFTNEQLFFIANAQLHCEKITEERYADFPLHLLSPARFRVNVPLANSKAFADAFQCPVGSPMNLKRKCCLLGSGRLSEKCE